MSDDNLRILRVTGSIYPEVVGGVGLHVHHMSRVQTEMGHDVTVLTSDNGNRSLPRKETRDGYRLLRHREIARPLDNTIIPGVISTLHNDLDEYDVLHIHSHLYFCSNVAALFSRLSSMPTVVTNHGLVSQTAPTWMQKVFNPTLGKFTFEAGDRILCYTNTDKQRLQDRGIDTDISVIPNGIDCSQFKPNGIEPQQQLLFVGRLKEGKGPHYLLDAFADLVLEHPELSLKLVGDGPLRDELEQQTVSLGIAEQVEFLGEVPNDELPKLYNESLAFILPSLSEGLPRTVLEAMVCETPVITTSLPQLKPIVNGAGVTVDPENAAKLAEAMLKLIEDPPLREKMGVEGRRKVTENYSWQSTVEETIGVYDQILENN
ncbi:Glycosyltransferase [Natrialba chahannaoensis JCM 10990]|uniref:Glycosyltransferase n=1 Tax=Natrialba chahannaoensis JCM 10990 TaxID=1227492 RepID=M0A2Q2_9EURY|nr:glycosyltransferase family 4 protein [Natrialba chahannaoensis]ELY93030.1 Glycosyltransferase [Natrialba chahannaoensis JCM 10990]